MIKISVLGHSPDAFPDVKSISYAIDNSIHLIQRQHNFEKDFVFLLNGNPGVGQWFCNFLTEKQLPYEMYLPTAPELLELYWSDAQVEQFYSQLNKAKAIHVFGVDNDYPSCIKRDKAMIDASQWVLVFWNGKHQGFTYNAMEYAIKSNKIVYNAFDGRFVLLSKDELKVNKDERLQEC